MCFVFALEIQFRGGICRQGNPERDTEIRL